MQPPFMQPLLATLPGPILPVLLLPAATRHLNLKQVMKRRKRMKRMMKRKGVADWLQNGGRVVYCGPLKFSCPTGTG